MWQSLNLQFLHKARKHTHITWHQHQKHGTELQGADTRKIILLETISPFHPLNHPSFYRTIWTYFESIENMRLASRGPQDRPMHAKLKTGISTVSPTLSWVFGQLPVFVETAASLSSVSHVAIISYPNPCSSNCSATGLFRFRGWTQHRRRCHELHTC